MDGKEHLPVVSALRSWVILLLVVHTSGRFSAGPAQATDGSEPPGTVSQTSVGPVARQEVEVGSIRRGFDAWTGTESLPAGESSGATPPVAPACSLWGREERSVVYRKALAEAKERYRRELGALRKGADTTAPSTAAEISTRFMSAVRAIEQTYENADLLVSPPEDETVRLSVKEIRLTGNTLISTDELLYGLPAVYVKQVKSKDGTTLKEVYDLRVLCETIGAPGPEREVSQRAIQGLTKYILSRYQDAGFAGIYVYVSADAIDREARFVDGVLPIRVIEARLADVTTKWFDFDGQERQEHVLTETFVEKHSPVQKGQVVRKKALDEYVRLLNVNPDRQVTAVASPSEEPNALHLTYDVYESDPWHFYAQLDNSGTDERQWNPRIGLVNTNLTGHDDRLSAMYQVDVGSPEENYAMFGLYEFPVLGPRFRLGLYAGISEFDITPEATGGLINFLGDGWFAGTTWRYNVAQFHDWMLDLTGSLSRETSRIDRSLGTDSDVDMCLVGLGCQIHRTSERSETSVFFERIDNYGGDSTDFQNARLGADPDFTRYSLGAAHWQFIDRDRFHQITGRFRNIWSDERLVPAKMTTFGGLYTVRGYEEDEIVADGGILASLEYRFYLSRRLSGRREDSEVGDKKAGLLPPADVSLVGFTDYGRPEIEEPLAGEFDTQNMWGIGVGTIIEIENDFLAAIYHGWALRETERASDGAILTDEGDTQWNFNFIYRW